MSLSFSVGSNLRFCVRSFHTVANGMHCVFSVHPFKNYVLKMIESLMKCELFEWGHMKRG